MPIEKSKSEALRNVDTLHGLLKIAIRDLRECERDQRYAVNMSCWHGPETGTVGPCYVCMAGATLAKSLGVDPSQIVFPDSQDPDVGSKMLAINSLRQGDVSEAAALMDMPHDAREFNRVMMYYPRDHEARKEFWRRMGRLYRDLLLAGL